MKIRIDALRIGQRVDLAGDTIADPVGYATKGIETNHPEFLFEYEIVSDIVSEGPDCIVVTFESSFSCGFPPDHRVDIDPEQETLTDEMTRAGYRVSTDPDHIQYWIWFNVKDENNSPNKYPDAATAWDAAEQDYLSR